MEKNVRVCVGALLVLVMTVGWAGAEIILDHEGSNDPATEGFGSPSGNMATYGPVTGDQGHNAWQINTMANYNAYGAYVPSLTSGQVATLQADGWQLTVVARVVEDEFYAHGPDQAAAVYLFINPYVYQIQLGLNSSGDTQVQSNSGTIYTLPGGSIYHAYTLYCPAGSTLATLYVDGVLTEENIQTAADGRNALYFGDLTANSPYIDNVNYSVVKLESPAGAPPSPPAATPTFSPGGGSYSGPLSVTISSTTPGATIYYTTDNTTPTTSSPNHGTSPLTITVTPPMTLRAVAAAAGWDTSAVASATYALYTPPTPLFDHEGSNDPATEGWGSLVGTIAAVVGPVTGDQGYDAWQINTLSNYNAYGAYVPYLNSSQVATLQANSWQLTVVARVVADEFYALGPDQAATVILKINPYLYKLEFGLDSSGNTQVKSDNGTIYTLPGGSIYHTYTLYCPAGSTLADLYVDGVLTEQNIQTADSGSLLWFGDVTANSPYNANVNYSVVKLVSPAAALPELPAATPTFSPGGGSYSGPQSVTISSTTPGATIYYTTDNTAPTTSSPNHGASPLTITVTPPMTVLAVAAAAGWDTSAVALATYTPYTPPTPLFDHEGSNDPATEGFGSPSGNMATYGPVAGDQGHDAWQINTMANYNAYGAYIPSLTSGQVTTLQANSWQLTVVARVVADEPAALGPDQAAAVYLFINPYVYQIQLGLNSSGDTQVQSNSGTIYTLPGGSIYHAYTLYCPAGSTLATLYVDGVLTEENIQTAADGRNALYFGDLTANSPYNANVNYSVVKLVSPAAALPYLPTTTPTFSPGGGSYSSPQTVTISSTTPGATIRYTTDGTTPAADNTTGTVYTGPVTVDHSLTLKARAFAGGYGASAVASATYAFVYTGGNIPHAAVVLDGNLSDWPVTQWSPPFVFWYGTGLTSTTKAKFAWNAAQNVLYATVQTDENSVQGGGHLVMGFTDNMSSVPLQSLDSTQLCFEDNNTYPGNVFIDNEIAHYLPLGPGVTTGVQAACDNASGVYTYEISLPLWSNWTYGTGQKPLSPGKVIYLYAVMQSNYSGTAPGTDMSYYGNPQFGSGPNASPNSWTRAAALTLLAPTSEDLATVLAAMDSTSSDLIWNSQADIDGDGTVTSTDLSVILVNMQ